MTRVTDAHDGGVELRMNDSSTELTREQLAVEDRADPLAPFYDEFVLPEGVIYLDGNSLGAQPKAAAQRSREVVEQEWGQGLIKSWNEAHWFDLPARLGDKVSELLSSGAGTAVVTDTTSLNLYKALSSALRIQEADAPGRRVIVTQRENFPSDIYIIQGLIDQLGGTYELRLVEDDEESYAEAIRDDVAVVVLTHVNYRTGRLFDMAAVTQQIHDAGALAIWDLCHSAGALPIDLDACDVDMAVGCTYKYLNSGPGGPAFIWVAERFQNRFWQPLSGWWGHANPFEMAADYVPSEGIRRFLSGTQPMVSASLVEVGLDQMLRADAQQVRTKSLRMADLLIQLVESRCAGHSLELVTPREHERRGSHVSFQHPEGYAIMSALIDRGVIGDYREPGILRFGITPLYLRYTDIWDAVESLRDILDTRAWDDERFRVRNAVT